MDSHRIGMGIYPHLPHARQCQSIGTKHTLRGRISYLLHSTGNRSKHLHLGNISTTQLHHKQGTGTIVVTAPTTAGSYTICVSPQSSGCLAPTTACIGVVVVALPTIPCA